MDTTLALEALMADKDKRIAEMVARERGRLGSFIRRRVPDPGEAEDILQDVFFEFMETYRLPEPIEQAGAWLYRVARNRIIDRFRKKKEEPLAELANDEDEQLWLDEVLPSPEAGPEAAYARRVLMEAFHTALEELPAEQSAVFIAHELEGTSFKELAHESGASINTLLARKRYAVKHLQARLQEIYDEFDL